MSLLWVKFRTQAAKFIRTQFRTKLGTLAATVIRTQVRTKLGTQEPTRIPAYIRTFAFGLFLCSIFTMTSCTPKPLFEFGSNDHNEEDTPTRQIDNRHTLMLKLQEILDVDSNSAQRYKERLLPDTTLVTPIVSILYQVNQDDQVSDMRIFYATSSIYAQDAMAHLKTTSKRDSTEGWHYQQWTFEVPNY